jgi:hypothetical protein
MLARHSAQLVGSKDISSFIPKPILKTKSKRGQAIKACLLFHALQNKNLTSCNPPSKSTVLVHDTDDDNDKDDNDDKEDKDDKDDKEDKDEEPTPMPTPPPPRVPSKKGHKDSPPTPPPQVQSKKKVGPPKGKAKLKRQSSSSE